MGIIRNVIGVFIILAIAYAMSSDRAKVKDKFKNILIMFFWMFGIGFVALRTTFGIQVLEAVSGFFGWLNQQAAAGVNFVFGGVVQDGAFVFFLNVLLPIIFFSALIGILDYLKILPLIMKAFGWFINKMTGMGELEGQYSIMTTMVGQPTVYVTIAEEIKKMSVKRLFSILLISTSTVSAATLSAYMGMVPAKYVVVAVLLNIFGAMIISAVINPYDPAEEDLYLVDNNTIDEKLHVDTAGDVNAEETIAIHEETEEKPNFVSVISDYISNGWNLALAVAATLVGFVALITFLNNGLEALIGISFTDVVGYIFSPVAFLIGVPNQDIVEVGSIMAQKLFTNEFVALPQVGALVGQLEEKSIAMAATYCLSFANLGTLGIVQGGIKAISGNKSAQISGYLGKLLIASTLVGLLVAAVVGMFF